jgi:hypothetical protein
VYRWVLDPLGRVARYVHAVDVGLRLSLVRHKVRVKALIIRMLPALWKFGNSRNFRREIPDHPRDSIPRPSASWLSTLSVIYIGRGTEGNSGNFRGLLKILDREF